MSYLKNYNIAFKEPSTNPVDIHYLRGQVEKKKLDQLDAVIALGGKDYTQMVRSSLQRKSKVFTPRKAYR